VRFPGFPGVENCMKNRFPFVVAAVAAAWLLTACSGGDSSQDSSSQSGELPRPTPSLAGTVEVGDGIPPNSARTAASSGLVLADASAGSRFLAQASAAPKSGTLSALSNQDPQNILNADQIVRNPWQPKNDNKLKLLAMPEETTGRLPTGKWFKGFFYQSPVNLDAYFNPNKDPQDPGNQDGDTSNFSIFPFPNKLTLDDRIGMVNISFPTRRYVAYNPDPNVVVYDLSNPYKADTMLYEVAPDGHQDLRLSYVQPGTQRLTRKVDAFDELTISTTWGNPAGDQGMTLIAAEGSPYVTVRYTGLRPVVQAGQGMRARRGKDELGLPNEEKIDYAQQESDNGIVAVAVGEEPLQKFIENNTNRVTPMLTGTKFRLLYWVPDRALAKPGTNDGGSIAPPSAYKEVLIYASSPITLEWDTPSRSYVARDNFSGVIRTAVVDDVLQKDWIGREAEISNLPSFKERRKALDAYAMTFPTSSTLLLTYDGGADATVTFRWSMERMDMRPAQDSELLMMGFDATHIPSLQNANRVSGFTYLSNFGSMSAVAGNTWTQKLTIPDILRNGASGEQLWFGASPISNKSKEDKDKLRAYLIRDARLLMTGFQPHCNYESYTCNKYLYNVSRLALIARELGETAVQMDLLAYLKQNLRPWFDGIDPTDAGYASSNIKENVLYDTVNGGIITLRGFKQWDDDYYNATYVDHMFHYGYAIFASAVLASQDHAWRDAYREKVNLLVRDIANPSLDDRFFPLMRTFDWFRMQNLADSGPDANGANTESSSESINSSYALGLWGAVIGDSPFQALAAIMTAGEIRTAQAFYQITPKSLPLREVEAVTVSVKLPLGQSGARALDPTQEPVRNIVRANNAETNVFFGPRLAYRVGIQLLPISPISEYVISADWARAHEKTLRELEDNQTALFEQAIGNAPSAASPCFLADYNGKDPVPPSEPAIKCTGGLRINYSWRQVIAAANGINDPANSYKRYLDYAEKRQGQEEKYFQVTNGVVSDVLKDTSTPSTDTNTLWWLLARKKN
jgi:endoglucanase Acf2